MKHILFTGGGSAGHVVPNLAIMRELRYVSRISYMGTGGIEQTLVTAAGYPFYRVDCPKLIRSFTFKNFAIPFALLRAQRRAAAVLRDLKPDLVFSKGGFASYPAVRAAQRAGIPVLTHESDLTPGLCTRLIARRCVNVLTSFEETAARFPNGLFVGSPVRRELFGNDRSRALHKLGLPEKRPVLLVFGGGSGSRCLDDAVRRHLPILLARFTVLHITANPDTMSADGYFPTTYISDMGSAYAAADVVLSRAGSNTLFELAALGKKAVVVPLAHASRGDQVENAAYFEQRGLVRVLKEEELDRLPDALFAAYESDGGRAQGSPAGTEAIVRRIRAVLAEEEGGASE